MGLSAPCPGLPTAAAAAAPTEEEATAAGTLVPSGAPAVGDGKSATRLEIEALYAAHNPAKLGEVPALCDKYGEQELLARVKQKCARASEIPASAPASQRNREHPTAPASAAWMVASDAACSLLLVLACCLAAHHHTVVPHAP
jgi:hypothetical protein